LPVSVKKWLRSMMAVRASGVTPSRFHSSLHLSSSAIFVALADGEDPTASNWNGGREANGSTIVRESFQEEREEE
jgi:hypothetical protein